MGFDCSPKIYVVDWRYNYRIHHSLNQFRKAGKIKNFSIALLVFLIMKIYGTVNG